MTTPINEAEDFKAISIVLEKEYGLKITELKMLAGLYDRTYNVNNGAYVVKIFFDPCTRDEGHIEGEIKMITFLKAKNFPVGEIIPTLSGKQFTRTEIADIDRGNQTFWLPVRLQEFLSGTLWFDKHVITPQISEAAGEITGRIDMALQDFQDDFYVKHSPLDYIVKCSDEWDIRKMIDLLNEQNSGKDFLLRRRLVEQTIAAFNEKVLPHLDKLPKQQIHGDAHWRNLFVDDDVRKIVGVIDFTDSRYTCRVYEIAIGLPSLFVDTEDPFANVEAWLTGYLKHVPLTQLELDIIMPCVCCRLALVMLVNEWYKKATPNTFDETYVISIFGPAWQILDQLLNDPLKRAYFQSAVKNAINRNF